MSVFKYVEVCFLWGVDVCCLCSGMLFLWGFDT